MNKGRIALIALIGAVVIVAGVSVIGIFASETANSTATQTAVSDKSMAAAVRTQIEKPLTPAKGEVKNLKKTSDEFDRIVGLDKLYAMHINDSLNPMGANKDRHAKIGEGHLGVETIVNVITHPKLKHVPFILETPNELEGYAAEIALLRGRAGE